MVDSSFIIKRYLIILIHAPVIFNKIYKYNFFGLLILLIAYSCVQMCGCIATVCKGIKKYDWNWKTHWIKSHSFKNASSILDVCSSLTMSQRWTEFGTGTRLLVLDTPSQLGRTFVHDTVKQQHRCYWQQWPHVTPGHVVSITTLRWPVTPSGSLTRSMAPLRPHQITCTSWGVFFLIQSCQHNIATEQTRR